MTEPRLGHRILVALLALSGLPEAAADAYRWTDDKGLVHYSDSVPQDQARHRRTKLDERGFAVEVVEAPKTAEQVRREKLLKQLRNQQELVLGEQYEKDKALMRTYRSTDEILVALRMKLDSLDSSIKLTQSSIARNTQSLEAHEKKAQELKKQGQSVPQSTLDSINILKRRIAAYHSQVLRADNEKLAVNDQFTKDLKRFQTIRAMQERNQQIDADWTRGVTSTLGGKEAGDINISAVECTEPARCDHYWALAHTLLTPKNGFPIAVETEKILQTAYPVNDTDFGITITRIPERDGEIVFMDVICRPTSLGEQLCKSARAQDIHERFRRTMTESPPEGASATPQRP